MIGCQILKRKRAVSLELAQQFLQVPVANVVALLKERLGL